MATLATTAIDVVGALFVELLQPFEEGLVAQPVEEDSSLQVTFGKFGGSAHVEDDSSAVCLSSGDERLRCKELDRLVGSRSRAKAQGRDEGHDQMFHINGG